jgi:hypothetical protein
MRNVVIKRCVASFALLLFAGAPAAAQEPPASDEKLARILKSVGESVERYHAALFSIRFTETWRWEELSKEFTPKEAREFVYDDYVIGGKEAGVEGDDSGQIVRRLLKVNGKPARPGRRGRDEPAPTSHTFLTFLRPEHQKDFAFTPDGEEDCAGRRCHVLSYRILRPQQRGAVWKGRSFKVFGPMAGRLWVDAENSDVLAWELRLTEPVEFNSPNAITLGPLGRFGPSRKLRYERDDFTVRFRRVEFKDPAQTLLLPESTEWVRVLTGASRPRVRITQTFTDYQRFVSDVKIIEEAEPENF